MFMFYELTNATSSKKILLQAGSVRADLLFVNILGYVYYDRKIRNKMDLNKNTIKIDPDYESNNTAIRNVELKEDEENRLTKEKLTKVLQETFDKELVLRQKQLEEIEEKVFKAQKLLHIVRYVLISSYYNNKALEYSDIKEESPLDSVNILTGQNQSRIHPAVKKLLGSNPTNLQFLNSKGKRKAQGRNTSTEFNVEPSTSQQPSIKKIKLEQDETSSSVNVIDQAAKSVVSSKLVDSDISDLMKNRNKTEHRIVVGNISYLKKSLEQDNLTHKWMVYVRIYKRNKEGPDVSHIINKVVFYLHPSYKPHDIVEVSKSPFHLSRRGWGEFPLRVQIVFKSSLNKPVVIIHNLKLEKTFVGRQTLGNETVVPIYLHDDYLLLNETVTNNEDIKIKTEYEEPKEQANKNVRHKVDNLNSLHENNSFSLDLASTSFEHDYCFDTTNIKIEREDEIEIEECVLEELEESTMYQQEEVQEVTVDETEKTTLLDHSYSLPYDEKDELPSSSKKENVIPNGQPVTDLIFGLDESYLDVNENCQGVKRARSKEIESHENKLPFKTLTTSTGQPIRFLPQSFSKVLLKNGSVVQVKLLKPPHSVLQRIDPQTQHLFQNNEIKQNQNDVDCKKCLERKINYEKYKLKIPDSNFKNVGEVLPYLFKRLPLWNSLANDVDFKCTYPFLASSPKEYRSWHIGKRLSSEWSRAKYIRNLLSESFPESRKWSTKAVFMYGRSHLFTPLPIKSYRIFENESPERDLLKNCFTSSRTRELHVENKIMENDNHVIDVESENDSSSGSNLTNHERYISDKNQKQECSFIKEIALDCGVVLKPEEISEGVFLNAAERVVLEAVKCFSEGLIRRSRHHLVCKGNFSENSSEISVSEVEMALSERAEFQSIQNFQKKRWEKDFFS